ncbi:MAG TPA: site-2 protease family protein [Baekduia sp.]|nr:site-2 protease family protein [Baekduia sp.]
MSEPQQRPGAAPAGPAPGPGHHRTTLHLGRLAGVPIGIQPLWLAIVGLLTYSLGHDYFPTEDPGLSQEAAYVLGLISALGLFLGILLHELGHAVVARRRGVEVEEIDLWLLGGVSRMHGEPDKPEDELRFAAAGPAVTLAIVLVLIPVRLAVGGIAPEWLRALIDYQLFVTAAILVFNLLPAFPLDGGRILRSLLWRRSGDRERATEQAAAGGRVFGWILVAFGVLTFAGGAIGGLWFALVGGFLIVASAAEAQGTRTRHALEAISARQLMTPDPVTLGADLTLDDAVVVGFSHHLFTAFPVVDDLGRAVGLLSIDAVRAVPAAARASRRVSEAMTADAALMVGPDVPISEVLGRRSFTVAGRAVVVGDDRRPIGILSVTDVQRRLRADALLPSLPRAA